MKISTVSVCLRKFKNAKRRMYVVRVGMIYKEHLTEKRIKYTIIRTFQYNLQWKFRHRLLIYTLIKAQAIMKN